MSLPSVPEQAIQAFETLHDLLVTVHDLDGSLWPYLLPERLTHRHPLCAAVKISHTKACVAFGVEQLRRDINRYPDGRVQVCHAGLVEFVYPVFDEQKLLWVFFAGLRTPGSRLTQAVRDAASPPKPAPWARNVEMPRAIDDREAGLALEALRQLAARLKLWAIEMQDEQLARKKVPAWSAGRMPELAARRTLIHRFVQTHHRDRVRLADLARALHLSESRAGHLVNEVCGATFLDLLLEARLRSAANLLRHTNLSILDVAAQSGFTEISHFHRRFSARFGVTPLKYRKQSTA